MKNPLLTVLFVLLTFCGFSQSQINILSQTKYETVFEFSLENFELSTVETPQGTQSIVRFEDGTPYLKKGAPDLAKLALGLAIPEAGTMEIEVLESQFSDIPNAEIAPSKGNFTRNIKPSDVPFVFGKEYSENAFFPNTLASLQTPFIMRNVRGQGLWVQPVQYNAVSKTLRVHNYLKIKVFHTNKQGENELSESQKVQPSRSFEQLYEKTFFNYEKHLFLTGADNFNFDGETMLVVVDDAYENAIMPLVEWKRQMGIRTKVVLTSETGSSDTEVFNFVQQMYQNEGLTYLLLVGDETDIEPIFRPSGGEDYACESCYGYMTGNDHVNEVFVGRFNATSAEEVSMMVARNLEYEKNPLRDTTTLWHSNGLAACSNEGAGIGDDDQADWEHGNEWKIKHLADGFNKYWEFYDGNHSSDSPTPGDATADQPGDPLNSDIIQVMNSEGVTLYNYTGHGWEQGLVSGNFSVQAVENQLQNTGKYPVIIGVACCSGDYTDNANGNCLGEAVQRAANPTTGEPYGAIAGYFSSDYQSWVPPMEGQDLMNEYIENSDGISQTPSTGNILVYGNAGTIVAYGNQGEVMADFWIPFTDPSTIIRTAFPQDLVASTPPQVYLGEAQITVTSAVEGALVGVFFQGQTIGVGIVENGVAVINFSSLSDVGDLTITVSQFNHVPYQITIPVVPQSGPFVVSRGVELDDATGDNDQTADYGETILLNVNLANVGLENAENVQVTLENTNPYITLLDATEAWGDMEDSTNLEKLGAFSFSVADNVEDGHKTDFNLHITYNDSLSYDALFSVKIQAPAFEIGDLVIDDLANGNGNGRLDNSEIVLVKIRTKNTGHSTAPQGLGQLSSNSSYLTIVPTFDLGSMADGDEVWATFQVNVKDNAPAGEPVQFTYEVAAGNYGSTALFDRNINSIVEDFESNGFNSFPWEFVQGNAPWQVIQTGAYEGTSCARSGQIGNNKKSQMKLTLDFTADGTVDFARKVSSEADWDFLRFFIDGQLQDEWSGEQDWAEVSYPITAGVHTLLWSYEKDDFVQDGQDRAWADAIILPPHQVVSSSQNLTIQGLSASIFPNPTSGTTILDIQLDEAKTLGLQIVNSMGQVVQQTAPVDFNRGKTQTVLTLETLPSGVYAVMVRDEVGVEVLQVVKE